MTRSGTGRRDDWDARVNADLDRVVATLDRDGPERFSRGLVDTLATLRDSAGAEWTTDVVPIVQRHAAVAIARECPLIGRATEQRRGCPCDAGGLDVIYRHQSVGKPRLSGRARCLHSVVQAALPSRAVRYRRMVLADAIDATAVATAGAEVMAVASGHLREVEWSLALATDGIGRFVAADHDRIDLAQVEADYGDRFPVIAPTPLSLRDLIGRRMATLGRFNLIYAAGLYNALPGRIARRLTARLFALLHPGGRLLIGNFAADIPEAAFIEAAMDWRPRWRTAAQVAAFAREIPESDTASRAVSPDPLRTCWYLDLRRSDAVDFHTQFPSPARVTGRPAPSPFHPFGE